MSQHRQGAQLLQKLSKLKAALTPKFESVVIKTDAVVLRCSSSCTVEPDF